ncbi:MAG TPA: 1,2-phenylacetyl-CoA epoxidase subunit PaaC [Burkholderiales bacterium]|nr:1,2-phenylacetyl-CoA epoxidase subunit PaaC [Burkholderiales bacterium]
MQEHFEYVLRIGDNALIHGQRLSEWCGHAPALEEDLALANIALDLTGQARLLLTHAGRLENKGRDEDQLAFLRDEGEYRNVTLVELPNGDFAQTILRLFLFAAFQNELWQAMQASKDDSLAAIAEKSLKESRYHLRHSTDWLVRLGDGTEESHARAQAALDALWPYTAEFFSADPTDEAVAAAGVTVAWSVLEPRWQAAVLPVLREATLPIPERSAFRSSGRFGRHSEHMGYLLAEMQYMQRAYPGAQW